mgnify:CR=1 FL=1
MRITFLGHSCFLVETGRARILIDPFLTGNPAELGPALAASSDVTALDLTGVEDDALTTEMEVLAADRVARVLIPPRKAPDWTEDPGLGRMRQFVTTTGLPTVA